MGTLAEDKIDQMFFPTRAVHHVLCIRISAPKPPFSFRTPFTEILGVAWYSTSTTLRIVDVGSLMKVTDRLAVTRWRTVTPTVEPCASLSRTGSIDSCEIPTTFCRRFVIVLLTPDARSDNAPKLPVASVVTGMFVCPKTS